MLLFITPIFNSLFMVGRGLRNYPGKEHVEIVHLLPFRTGHNEADLTENLNEVLKAILCSMLLEDVLKPVRIKDSAPVNAIKSKPMVPQPFMELIPDTEKRLAVLRDLSLC